jgi:hypothetical protein
LYPRGERFVHLPLAARQPGEEPFGILRLGGVEFKNFRLAREGEAPRGYAILREGSGEIVNVLKDETNARDFAVALGCPANPMMGKYLDEEFADQGRQRFMVCPSGRPSDSEVAGLNRRLIERSLMRGRGEVPMEPLMGEDAPVFPVLVPPPRPAGASGPARAAKPKPPTEAAMEEAPLGDPAPARGLSPR